MGTEMIPAVGDFLATWLATPFLCWGIGPYVVLNISFWMSVVLIEGVNFFAKSSVLIDYTSSRTMEERLKSEPPLSEQLFGSLMTTMGPVAISNVVLLAKIGPWLIPGPYPNPTSASFTTLVAESAKFFGLILLKDSFYYFTHRMAHGCELLYKQVHSHHHKIHTPRATGTGFMTLADATLLEGLPCIASAAIIQPHPLTFYAFLVSRTAESVSTHSGVSCDSWLAVLFLKSRMFLAFGLAGNEHHDQHHKFSDRSINAKNFAERFIFLDYLFGTLSTVRTQTKSTS